MISVIGVGQAGGNMADEFAKQNIPALAINYSERDLKSLEHVSKKLKLVGSEGVGKVRENAIKLMNDNWESTIEFIRQSISTLSIEVVFVIFSTGGGSGSGVSPLILEMLTNELPEKVFVACPIIPDKSEAVINQINTVNTTKEIYTQDLCIIPIDNEQAKENFKLISKNRIYNKVNTQFVDLLSSIVSYTKKSSKYGVLDRKDLKQIFSTKGICILSKSDIAEISDTNLTSEGVTNAIQYQWKKNIFSPIDYNQVIRAGVIYDGQEALMDYLPIEKIYNVFKNGIPVDLFEGYYTEQERNGTVYTILGGLPWINARLNEISKLIEEKQSVIHLQQDNSNTLQNDFKDFTSKVRKEPVPKRSVTEILAKYNR
ncbi:cell division protein FtsZ [Bacillus sp. SCS-151]|uniref:cell division protein FtsZ n=1 Tax=Nanhaiella sioensis TaxID=3115293 RepID=UPI00397E4E76